MNLRIDRMQLVVPVGGLGTRLGPIVGDGPKCLVDIDGVPFLQRLLTLYVRQGLRRFVLCTGHCGAEVRSAVARMDLGPGVHVAFSHEERPLGLSGSLVLASDLLEPWFFLTYGDTYAQVPLTALIAKSNAHGAGVLTVVPAQYVGESPNTTVTDGWVKGYDKVRPALAAHVDYGLHMLPREIVDDPQPDDRLFDALARAGRLAALQVDEPFHEIGTPQAYRRVRDLFRTGELT